MEYQIGPGCLFCVSAVSQAAQPGQSEGHIARGVENGMLGYVGKKPDGTYVPFHWKSSVSILDIEISDDTYIIQKEPPKHTL